MNKKLLAVAIAGAFVAPAAMADTSNVTIGGTIGVEIGSVNSSKSSQAGASDGRRKGVVNSSNGTELHFKGTEDLGNGLSAVWFVGQDLQVDGTGYGTAGASPTHFGSRNVYAGLESKQWGRFIAGKHDSAYKFSTGKLDMFSNTVADYNALMGSKGFSVAAAGTTSAGVSNNGGNNNASHDSRYTDMVMYSTPTINGFSANAQYGFTADTVAQTTSATSNKGSIYALNATYENGPIFATLAHEETKTAVTNTTSAAAKDKATKVGFGYNFGAFKVAAIWEKTRDNRTGAQVTTIGSGVAATANLLANEQDRRAWYLGGSYTMGKTVLKVAYTDMGDLKGITNSGAKQWSVGADYNLSKRTKVYALYTKLSNEENAAYSLGQGAMQVGTNTSGTAQAGGADPSALAIGMQHSF